jgi:hypothetical protein
MQFVECATFHLNTTDVDITNTGNVNNQYGSVNQYRNDITWFNISFKTILGDMYEKYDKFNIKLSSIMYSQAAAPSINQGALSLKVNLVGLPFSNCTYHSLNNSNSQFCTMGSFTMGINATQTYYNDDNVFTIEKPSASTNVRIYLSTLSDTVPVWASLGPQFDFYFRVYGVKKNEN